MELPYTTIDVCAEKILKYGIETQSFHNETDWMISKWYGNVCVLNT